MRTKLTKLGKYYEAGILCLLDVRISTNTNIPTNNKIMLIELIINLAVFLNLDIIKPLFRGLFMLSVQCSLWDRVFRWLLHHHTS